MQTPSSADIARAQLRVAAIRVEISSRLWSVNQGMNRFKFNELMDQMALLQFNCERRTIEETRDGERRLGQPDRRTLSALLKPSRRVVAEEFIDDDAQES